MPNRDRNRHPSPLWVSLTIPIIIASGLVSDYVKSKFTDGISLQIANLLGIEPNNMTQKLATMGPGILVIWTLIIVTLKIHRVHLARMGEFQDNHNPLDLSTWSKNKLIRSVLEVTTALRVTHSDWIRKDEEYYEKLRSTGADDRELYQQQRHEKEVQYTKAFHREVEMLRHELYNRLQGKISAPPAVRFQGCMLAGPTPLLDIAQELEMIARELKS